MVRKLSEKASKLNVFTELLHCMRSRTGREMALWLGFTQAQERPYGLTSYSRLVTFSGEAIDRQN